MKNVKKRVSVTLSALLVFLILSVSAIYLIERNEELENADTYPDRIPSFITRSSDGVRIYDHDDDRGRFIERTFIPVDEPLSVETWNDTIFISHRNGIIEYNEFNGINNYKIKNMGVLAIHQGLLHYSANSSYIISDLDLNTLSIMTFNFSSWFNPGNAFRKNVHDILCLDNRSYLLDNIMMPIWVFSVDITDPEKPILLTEERMTSVNVHLEDQWIDEKNGYWMILQRNSVMGGSYQKIMTRDLDENDTWEYIHSAGRSEWFGERSYSENFEWINSVLIGNTSYVLFWDSEFLCLGTIEFFPDMIKIERITGIKRVKYSWNSGPIVEFDDTIIVHSYGDFHLFRSENGHYKGYLLDANEVEGGLVKLYSY